jgi:hypothetical protein
MPDGDAKLKEGLKLGFVSVTDYNNYLKSGTSSTNPEIVVWNAMPDSYDKATIGMRKGYITLEEGSKWIDINARNSWVNKYNSYNANIESLKAQVEALNPNDKSANAMDTRKEYLDAQMWQLNYGEEMGLITEEQYKTNRAILETNNTINFYNSMPTQTEVQLQRKLNYGIDHDLLTQAEFNKQSAQLALYRNATSPEIRQKLNETDFTANMRYLQSDAGIKLMDRIQPIAVSGGYTITFVQNGEKITQTFINKNSADAFADKLNKNRDLTINKLVEDNIIKKTKDGYVRTAIVVNDFDIGRLLDAGFEVPITTMSSPQGKLNPNSIGYDFSKYWSNVVAGIPVDISNYMDTAFETYGDTLESKTSSFNKYLLGSAAQVAYALSIGLPIGIASMVVKTPSTVLNPVGAARNVINETWKQVLNPKTGLATAVLLAPLLWGGIKSIPIKRRAYDIPLGEGQGAVWVKQIYLDILGKTKPIVSTYDFPFGTTDFAQLGAGTELALYGASRGTKVIGGSAFSPISILGESIPIAGKGYNVHKFVVPETQLDNITIDRIVAANWDFNIAGHGITGEKTGWRPQTPEEVIATTEIMEILQYDLKEFGLMDSYLDVGKQTLGVQPPLPPNPKFATPSGWEPAELDLFKEWMVENKKDLMIYGSAATRGQILEFFEYTVTDDKGKLSSALREPGDIDVQADFLSKVQKIALKWTPDVAEAKVRELVERHNKKFPKSPWRIDKSKPTLIINAEGHVVDLHTACSPMEMILESLKKGKKGIDELGVDTKLSLEVINDTIIEAMEEAYITKAVLKGVKEAKFLESNKTDTLTLETQFDNSIKLAERTFEITEKGRNLPVASGMKWGFKNTGQTLTIEGIETQKLWDSYIDKIESTLGFTDKKSFLPVEHRYKDVADAFQKAESLLEHMSKSKNPLIRRKAEKGYESLGILWDYYEGHKIRLARNDMAGILQEELINIDKTISENSPTTKELAPYMQLDTIPTPEYYGKSPKESTSIASIASLISILSPSFMSGSNYINSVSLDYSLSSIPSIPSGVYSLPSLPSLPSNSLTSSYISPISPPSLPSLPSPPSPSNPSPPSPSNPTSPPPNDYVPLFLPNTKAEKERFGDKPSKKLTEFRVIFYFKNKDTKRLIEARSFNEALRRTWFDRGSNVIPKRVKVIRIGERMPKK